MNYMYFDSKEIEAEFQYIRWLVVVYCPSNQKNPYDFLRIISNKRLSLVP